jgi:hypothetical protein
MPDVSGRALRCSARYEGCNQNLPSRLHEHKNRLYIFSRIRSSLHISHKLALIFYRWPSKRCIQKASPPSGPTPVYRLDTVQERGLDFPSQSALCTVWVIPLHKISPVKFVVQPVTFLDSIPELIPGAHPFMVITLPDLVRFHEDTSRMTGRGGVLRTSPHCRQVYGAALYTNVLPSRLYPVLRSAGMIDAQTGHTLFTWREVPHSVHVSGNIPRRFQ